VKIKKSELHAPKEILSGHNDHRIVMSLAVLASIFGGEIDGSEAVKKSYPDFFRDIEQLGIKCKHYEP
jgi:3-phosphoshikimate 1-carboxyvinyltransferase